MYWNEIMVFVIMPCSIKTLNYYSELSGFNEVFVFRSSIIHDLPLVIITIFYPIVRRRVIFLPNNFLIHPND